MFVSCSTLVCPQREYPTIGAALAKIRELGFAAVDLAAFEGWQNVNPSELVASGEAWTRELIATLGELGLRVSSLNCGLSQSLTDPDEAAFAQVRRELVALADLAERVGCPNVTVQPGRAAEGQGFEAAFETARAHLAMLAPLAHERGVSLSVEAHHGSLLEDPEQCLRLMEALWPSVGLTYDPSHFAMQEVPLPETARLLDCARHVHVRNAASGKMQETMAEGVVDFAWLVGALGERHYAGALAIEYFSGYDPDFTSTLALRDRLVALGVEG